MRRANRGFVRRAKRGFVRRANRGFACHSKSWIPWIPESSDNLEFSADRLSENAKTISLST